MTNKTMIRNWTILVGSSMTVLAGATIAPALPAMTRAFQDVPNADFLVRLVLTIPALLIAIGAPFSGVLLDRWGRKPVLIYALILYGLAGTAGFILNTLTGILISRALLGLAVAGVMSGFTTLVADYFAGEKLNQFMGYQAGVMGFGGVLFLLAGGFLADIGWQYPFLIYLFAFVVLPGVLWAVNEPEIQTDSQKRTMAGETAVINWPPVAFIYLIGFLGMLLFYIAPVQLPFYLTAESGVSSAQVGQALSAQALAAAIVSLLYQKFRAHLSHAAIASLVFLTMGIGYGILAFTASYAPVLLGLLISGIGLGLLVPNINVWLVSMIPAAVRGRAIGGLTMAIFLGQFISPIVTQPVAQRFGLDGAFGAAGGLLLLLAVAIAGGMIKNAAKTEPANS